MIRLLLLLLILPATAWGSYAERPEVQTFMRELVKRHGFVESELKRVFARVKRADPVLEAISRPAERVRTWEEYRTALLTERRVAEGLEFWKKYRRTLERAERKYGVAPEYVVAIIGVETFYGRNTGNWRVVDALTTLAFDYPPRSSFFRNELEQYLLFARNAGVDVFSVRGSYAGAIGLPQFMPSSTRAYAVDFDGNGHIDLQKSRSDAIGSVANFLKVHGWQRDADVLVNARVAGDAWRPFAEGLEPKHSMVALREAGIEFDSPQPAGAPVVLVELASGARPSDFRVGLRNFYVITRYNRSAFYAAAVADLARALRQGYDLGR
ncbi:MAG TPA: lytic murein transglycosylase B [Burkholderiales bacterium]|nr:lytic murein transglycosylase B [Burkholderiales bacterium]